MIIMWKVIYLSVNYIYIYTYQGTGDLISKVHDGSMSLDDSLASEIIP